MTESQTPLAEIEMSPVSEPIQGAIRPPGSKSITNRALIIAALADGTSRLTGTLASEDTHVMLESLRRLGLEWTDEGDGTISIQGCGGNIPADKADLWLENSGTSIRFLTAACSLGNGEYRLDGNSRMRERPIRDLVQAISQFGVDIRCELDSDCPPVLINTTGLPGGTITVPGNLSSQYLSALLMVAPYAKEPVEIVVSGELVSVPYVEMTLQVMQSFGVNVEVQQMQRFRIQPQTYKAREYAIEPDASAASYFFAAAAVTGGNVTVKGLHRDALQGDVHFVEALRDMGCDVQYNDDSITVIGKPLKGVDIDMNAISDTAQTLAAVAVFANGPTRVRNVAHMRIKETDRVSAVVNELRRLGIETEEHEDGFTIHPGPTQPALIETYNDHRMAMSFSLIGLRNAGVRISNPGCTAKTYPHYFEDLGKLCGE
ncbi:3-phosphoshikimate 1-carboxyvinyltransferase [Rubinisphaera sp. JC750]|uniref:3-phosphoshikimate 1-carboxyvinyltransferase n=1 Tax=Rubinisphaera sp. JC750 TaxID=2898658 RepID=UPI001F001C33|nr:3-phosphoshikimate 1-carboxyvinyltransferase [Rubinisphaera sp. JC750]